MTGTRLFTDADNTLWDTDSVFAQAQVGLLRDMEAEVGSTVPERHDTALAFVRGIDQRIAASHPDHLRYPPVLLASAIAWALVGEAPERAADAAFRAGAATDAHSAAVRRYEQRLRAVPELREGVREGLDAIHRSGVPITILTEARLDRCGWLIKAHDLSRFVVDVLSVKKDVDVYRVLRKRADDARFVMVGDQEDRDIEAAKHSGFTTIIFPSGFVPVWNHGKSTAADYTIQRFDEIPALLLSSADGLWCSSLARKQLYED